MYIDGFSNSTEKELFLNHLRILFTLAFADKSLKKEEEEILIKIGMKAGLSLEEIVNLSFLYDTTDLYPPQTDQERIEYIIDLVSAMALNGEITKEGVSLLKYFAFRLGLPKWLIEQEAEWANFRNRLNTRFQDRKC